MIDVFDVAKLFIEHAKTTNPKEVGIIAYYGSYATGTATETSDLDLIYIPDNIETTRNLYNSFILEGRPYEFWGISWERLERMANGDEHWAVAAGLIMNLKLLYYRNEEDLNRFNGLLNHTRSLMTPEYRPLMVKKGLKAFTQVQNNLGKLHMEITGGNVAGTRWSAWQVIISCVECLALINQHYFNNGWGKNNPELLSMEKRPERLGEIITKITTSNNLEAIGEAADQLAQETRKTLYQAQRETAEPTGVENELKDFYPGIHEYVNKMRKYLKTNEALTADYSAALIQYDVSSMLSKGQTGIADNEFNLYSEIYPVYKTQGFPDLMDPSKRKPKITEFDRTARKVFTKYGLSLNEVQSLEDLKRFFEERAKDE